MERSRKCILLRGTQIFKIPALDPKSDGLAYYVEQHHVKLPDDFTTYIRQNAFAVPQCENDGIPSTGYWRSRCRRQWNSDD